MTGLRAGSQGTGLREGSWEGSGVGGSDPLPPSAMYVALMALSPVGYWVLDDDTDTAIDSSGNGNHGTYSGDYTLNAETGPDGREYAHFLSDFVGDGHGARVTVPTTAVDGSFSAATHGLTAVTLIKKDTPPELGYIFSKRSGVSTDREYEMSYTGEYRVDMFDGDSFLGGTTTPSDNSTDWELLVYRVPTIEAASDPWEIFIDSSTPGAPDVADPGSAGYIATDSSLGIGGFPDTQNYGHNGSLAHVAFYDYELSDAEIESIVQAATADGWIPAGLVSAAVPATFGENNTGSSSISPANWGAQPGDGFLCSFWSEGFSGEPTFTPSVGEIVDYVTFTASGQSHSAGLWWIPSWESGNPNIGTDKPSDLMFINIWYWGAASVKPTQIIIQNMFAGVSTHTSFVGSDGGTWTRSGTVLSGPGIVGIDDGTNWIQGRFVTVSDDGAVSDQAAYYDVFDALSSTGGTDGAIVTAEVRGQAAVMGDNDGPISQPDIGSAGINILGFNFLLGT